MIVYQTTVHISLPYQLCQRAKNTQTGKPAFAYFINSGCVGPDISSACDKVGLYIMGYPTMSRWQSQLFNPNQPFGIRPDKPSAGAPASGSSALRVGEAVSSGPSPQRQDVFHLLFLFSIQASQSPLFSSFLRQNLSNLLR